MEAAQAAGAQATEARDSMLWAEAIGALTLDLCAGLLTAMGLVCPDEALLRGTLRRCVTQARLENTSLEGFVDLALREVGAAFGEPFLAYFTRWLGEVYQNDSRRGLSALLWDVLMGQDGGAAPGPKVIPALVVGVRAGRAQSPTPRDLHMVMMPESAWDRDFFAFRGYSLHPYQDGPEALHPMTAVLSTIRHVDFCRAWEAATARRGALADDLDELSRWGQRETARRGMPSALLGRPGAWPPLPRPPRASPA